MILLLIQSLDMGGNYSNKVLMMLSDGIVTALICDADAGVILV